jgi:hypothetical protein
MQKRSIALILRTEGCGAGQFAMVVFRSRRRQAAYGFGFDSATPVSPFEAIPMDERTRFREG